MDMLHNLLRGRLSSRSALLRVGIGSLFLLGFCAAPSWAHHSYSSFDTSTLELHGVVKEFQWTNPHVWIQVLVPNTSGGPVEWGVETAAPGMLKRQGWSAHTVKEGDKVVVYMHQKKDGSNEGSLIKILLPDNTILAVRDLVLAAPGSPIPSGGPPGGPPGGPAGAPPTGTPAPNP